MDIKNQLPDGTYLFRNYNGKTPIIPFIDNEIKPNITKHKETCLKNKLKRKAKKYHKR